MQAAQVHIGGSRRAFSLVEMMVVLLILGVVLAIIVPSLGAARNAARKAATNALMNQLATASAAFQMDERRMPGYFSARDMGHTENETRGFSAMNNVLADLSGGLTTDNALNPLTVGPRAGAANEISIAPGLIGSSRQINGVTNKAYFQPDPKFFGVVTGKATAGANSDHQELPDLFDSWGTPILAWQQDEMPNTTGDFATRSSNNPAKFYWMQNSVFLKSTNLGKFTIDQASQSLIGDGAGGAATSLQAVLGTPAFTDPTNNAVPADGRAKLIFQSAGYNSTYCGRSERGGKLAAANGNVIRYTSPNDAMEAFDDLMAKSSN